MSKMTSDELSEIEEREQGATPGPWSGDPEPYAIYIYGADKSPVADTHVPGKYDGSKFPAPDFDDGERGGVDAVLRLRGVGASKHRKRGSLENNYRFMIHARSDIPSMTKEIRECWKKIAELEKRLEELKARDEEEVFNADEEPNADE
jgi:hypothetical protein